MRARFSHKDIEAAFNASCAGAVLRAAIAVGSIAFLLLLALRQVSS